MKNNGFGIAPGQEPWSPAPGLFFDHLRERLPFAAAAVGVFHVRRPRPDELLAIDGLPGEAVLRWCNDGWDSELFRTAKRRGIAIARGSETGDPDLARFDQVMALTLPESLTDSRAWWLILGTTGREFSPLQQQDAALLLRQWQVAFDQARDPAAGRVLLGADNRLIQADPWTRTRMLREPQLLDDLLHRLQPVVAQRYPELSDLETRDVAMDLGGHPFWVCFHRHAPAPTGGLESRHWYLELHPLEKDELPTVGQVGDERISRSLAFIHENFGQAPSLAQTAAAAHVSPFHFHRLFTQSVGISPKQYVQRKQLQVARFLLRSTRKPVGDIAAQAGFSSHGHFTSTFHRLVGQSPRDYRESH